MQISFSLTIGRSRERIDGNGGCENPDEAEEGWDIVSDEEVSRIPKRWGRRNEDAASEDPDSRHQHHNMLPDVNEQSRCRLFKLPSEIRLQIYEHAFHLTTKQASLNCPCHRSSDAPSILSLLQTCRRIRNETETLFYTLNRLTISSENLRDFINSLGPRRLAAISRLTVLIAGEADAHRVLTFCSHALSLKSLYLTTKLNLRYVSIRAWRVMATQIKTAIAEMKGLEEIRLLVTRAEKDRTEEDERKEDAFERYCRDLGQSLKSESGAGLVLRTGRIE